MNLYETVEDFIENVLEVTEDTEELAGFLFEKSIEVADYNIQLVLEALDEKAPGFDQGDLSIEIDNKRELLTKMLERVYVEIAETDRKAYFLTGETP